MQPHHRKYISLKALSLRLQNANRTQSATKVGFSLLNYYKTSSSNDYALLKISKFRYCKKKQKNASNEEIESI